MATPTPNFGIPAPGPTTPANKLGAELLAFGIAIDSTLKAFTYDGADPNAVLARVTSLETWRTSAAAKLAELEDISKERAWCTRTAQAPTIPSANYLDITQTPYWTAPTLKGGVTWNDGFVVPRAGRYLVSMSFVAAGAADVLFGFSKQPTANYNDFISGQNGRSVQTLAMVSASAEIDMAAGERIKAYALASTGTLTLKAAVGAFSIRRVE